MKDSTISADARVDNGLNGCPLTLTCAKLRLPLRKLGVGDYHVQIL